MPVSRPEVEIKLIAQNPKARHDYEILDTFEAGVSLTGGEVKSAKAGHVSIKEAFVNLHRGEAWLKNCYIKPYEPAEDSPEDASRDRKLLLHKNEIAKLTGAAAEKGQTIVPLKLGLVRGFVKIEIALGRGKKQFDKRATLKKREQAREAEREVRERLR